MSGGSRAGKRRAAYWLTGAACLLAVFLSLSLGAARLSPAQLWEALRGGPKSTAGAIFWYARAPRTAACVLAGAALAAAGCVIQGVLQNPLASPGIIGVNAGAGLAVSICCACGVLSGWTLSLAAFAGAMACVALVALLAGKTGASRTVVILTGVAVNSVGNALSEGVRTLFPEAGMLGGDFRVGGFSAVSTPRLIPGGVLIVLALAVTFTLCGELDVLALGDDTARGLGLSVGFYRGLFLLLAALLAGASVSFSGLLGFVGLIVPNAVRRLVGSETRPMLILCALGGGALVTLCDLAARLVFAPFELPVGVLLAVLGGPFFLVLLLGRRRRRD